MSSNASFRTGLIHAWFSTAATLTAASFLGTLFWRPLLLLGAIGFLMVFIPAFGLLGHRWRFVTVAVAFNLAWHTFLGLLVASEWRTATGRRATGTDVGRHA